MQDVATGNRYDTVIINDNAAAHLGDLHVHFHVEQISCLQQLLCNFESRSYPHTDYQRTISHLDAISVILLQINQIQNDAHTDDRPLLQSLHLTVSATLDFVQEQALALQRLVNDVRVAPPHFEGSASGHSSSSLSADEVARSLHHYLNNQLLLLNTTLQLLQKKAERRKARLDLGHHNDLHRKADAQAKQLRALQSAMQSSVNIAQQSRRTLERLAEQSLQHVKALNTMQHALSRLPALAENDSILFRDALNRRFKLPYVDFVDFKFFEIFLKQQFHSATIPGGTSVAAGRYLIANQNNSKQVATRDSWTSMVYPGCRLTMSVILNMLSLSILQCPRPTCGEIANNGFEDGKFITCRKCGLRYRFDRAITLPSAAKQEENLMVRQIEQDRAEFGDINLPAEVFGQDREENEVLETASPPLVNDRYEQLTIMASAPMPARIGHHQGDHHVTDQHLQSPRSEAAIVGCADPEPGGASALRAWIDNVVVPTTPLQLTENDDFAAEVKARQKELRDLESLQNVHFVELKPTTETLVKSSPNFKDMPLDAQIHYRKIVDKYPGLSVVVAERIAKTNVRRSCRIEQIKNENDMKEKRRSAGTKAPATQPSEQSLRGTRPWHKSDKTDTYLHTGTFRGLQRQGQGVMGFFRKRRR